MQKPINQINPKLQAAAWFSMLIVVGSIAFSTYMVYFGTTDLLAKLLLIPQVAFAGGVLLYKFVK